MGRDLPQSASKQQEQQEDREPMPVAVIHELAQRLYNLDESSTNEALQMVRDCQDVGLTIVEGEIELEIDLLTNYTLWKLYDFTERCAQAENGVAHELPSPMTSPGSSSDAQPA